MKHSILPIQAIVQKAALLFIFILSTIIVTKAQTTTVPPQGMSYQTIIRNSSNALVTNTAVGIKISITSGNGGSTVYSETFTPTTNSNGLASLTIGLGTPVSGTFSAIPWSSGNLWIATAIDLSGGSSYTPAGSNQLLSVPYALYAASSGGSLPTTPTTIPTSGLPLVMCPGGVAAWGGCPLNAGNIISTSGYSSLTSTSVNLGGQITNTGLSGNNAIASSGVYYWQSSGVYTASQPPAGANNVTSTANQGSFIVSVSSNLTQATQYAYMAYVTTVGGQNLYGSPMYFTPPVAPVAPLVTDNNYTSLATTSVTLNATASSGGASITGSGFILVASSAQPSTPPTLSSNGVIITTSGLTPSLTALTSGTTYWAYGYATNSAGTGYATTPLNFTTQAVVTAPTVSFLTGTTPTTIGYQATISPIITNSTLASILINLVSNATATGTNILNCGFKYSTNNGATWIPITSTLTPSTFGINLNNGSGSAISSLVASTSSQTILLQAFASNSAGTGTAQASIIIPPLAQGMLYAGGVIVNITGSAATIASTQSLGPLPYYPSGSSWSQTQGFTNIGTIGNGRIGTTDGINQTNAIASFYSGYTSNTYAAGACLSYTDPNGFSGWYLPTNTEIAILKGISMPNGTTSFYSVTPGYYFTCNVGYNAAQSNYSPAIQNILVGSFNPSSPYSIISSSYYVLPFRQLTIQ